MVEKGGVLFLKDKQKIPGIFQMVLMKRLLMRTITEISARLRDIRQMLQQPGTSNITTPRTEENFSTVT